MLLRNTSFTLVAALALALGIGANSAIFSIVNSVLFRPLPYQDPKNLVMIWENHQQLGGPEREWASPADLRDWKEQAQSFSTIAALLGWGPTLTGQDQPEDLQGAAVSAETFSMLGVEPSMGRNFSADDDRPGAERVVILSDKFWHRRFGGEPGIIGKPITLSGNRFTVVGVMPRRLSFPILTATEIWTPVGPILSSSKCDRGCVILRVIARLRDGVSMDAARAEMAALSARIAEKFPETNDGVGVTLIPLQEQLVGQVRVAMLVLLGAVALVLLIACANVANLLLSRAASREKEVAIRAALGASRLRLIRQHLTESLVLGLIGGAAGLLIAFWMVDVLIGFAPKGTPRLEEIGIDKVVLAFTFGVALLTGIAFGLAPALLSSRANLSNALKEGGRDARSSSGSHRVRSALVVSEVALALMLLVGAGLLIRSFVKLQQVDPGFDPKNVLRVDVGVPRARYATAPRVAEFFKQLVDRVSALPGVEAAGGVSTLPLSGGGTDTDFLIEGHPAPEINRPPVSHYSKVTPDYFRAMGIRLLKGRLINEGDVADAPTVALISESLANRYFPDEEPIGRGLLLGKDRREIVGVVTDVKFFGLNLDSRPMMYFPEQQYPERGLSIVVKTSVGDPMTLASAVRNEVRNLDHDIATSNEMTMESLVSSSLAEPRFALLLLGVFAGAALLLSVIGVYGVVSYSVSQRSHEIGVRMALGAQMNDVIRLVLGQGMALVGVGLGIGLLGALVFSRVMQSLLFGVGPRDVATLALTAVVLAIVALGACLVPARRATKVDPMVALRYE